jgi:predicted acylesterase/phospholipase RssA
MVFKPVRVTTTENYEGWWVDGGVLNNFPLHAFDREPVDSSASGLFRGDHQLHPGVLGFRLVDGFDLRRAQSEGYKPFNTILPSMSSIDQYLAAVFQTLMYPSAGGQITNSQEFEQVIDIDPTPLLVVDFSPSVSALGPPARKASESVTRYFE